MEEEERHEGSAAFAESNGFAVTHSSAGAPVREVAHSFVLRVLTALCAGRGTVLITARTPRRGSMAWTPDTSSRPRGLRHSADH